MFTLAVSSLPGVREESRLVICCTPWQNPGLRGFLVAGAGSAARSGDLVQQPLLDDLRGDLAPAEPARGGDRLIGSVVLHLSRHRKSVQEKNYIAVICCSLVVQVILICFGTRRDLKRFLRLRALKSWKKKLEM